MNIIQIGCNTGNDHVYEFIKSNKCNNILLIDANPYVLDICKTQYLSLNNNNNNINFLNYAIVPDTLSDTIKFYIPKEDKMSAHCSVSAEFVVRHLHPELEELDIPCLTINNLCRRYNINNIDRLYIDAEGLDAKIVSSIDFSYIDIKYIYFEYTHTDGAFNRGENFKNSYNYLLDNQYILTNNDGYNLSFEKQTS